MYKTYKLFNNMQNKENKIINSFKNSFLVEDIGIKSDNFKIVLLLSTILAIGTLFTMYFLWRI